VEIFHVQEFFEQEIIKKENRKEKRGFQQQESEYYLYKWK